MLCTEKTRIDESTCRCFRLCLTGILFKDDGHGLTIHNCSQSLIAIWEGIQLWKELYTLVMSTPLPVSSALRSPAAMTGPDIAYRGTRHCRRWT